MMRAARRAACIALAFACLSGAAVARQKSSNAPGGQLLQRSAEVDREVDAGYGGGLHVATGPHGDVHVTAWRQQKIRVEARIELNAPTEADLDELTKVIGIIVDPSPTSVDVTTKGPHDKQWMKGLKGFPKGLSGMPWRIDYIVHVPEFTSLSIEVNDGFATVEGVTGIISVISARGDVHLSNIAGATRVSAAGGSIAIETRDRGWRNGNLTAQAVGDIIFTAPAGYSAYLTAGAGGKITITDAEGEKDLGDDVKQNVGAGGATMNLTAGGKVEILLGRSP